TSSRVATRKEVEIKTMAAQRGIPLVYLADAGGARMPDIMGAVGLASYGGGSPDATFQNTSRVRKTPLVTAVMGECYGMPTWMACMADFVVQIKGTAIGVSGPRVLEIALSETITDEELGGWEVHAKITGMTDAVVNDEEECFQTIKRFLSYMPSNKEELPPVAEVSESSGTQMDDILTLLPEKRNRGYDMRRILERIVDKGSLFPIKPFFGQNTITALARVNGRVVGLIANNPLFGGGAMDTDGIDKVISFFCMCDTFNIPLIFFHDIPGFLIGKDAERKRVAARVINYMNAFAQVTVPTISIIIRKSYGMAFVNMGGTGCNADFLVAWPTAEISFVDPEIAANVVFGGKDENAKERDDMVKKMVEDSSPYGAAGLHYLHDVIEPKYTRDYIIKTLEIAQYSIKGGISEHRLANWPTKF
ncbi:acyl-CoA carboxylase subunit beta, partial [Thermodesulfobacteriota bacterium]